MLSQWPTTGSEGQWKWISFVDVSEPLVRPTFIEHLPYAGDSFRAASELEELTSYWKVV